MFTSRNVCRRNALILASGILAVARPLLSAEHSAPNPNSSQSAAAPANQTKPVELPNDLTFGKSTNDNLAFKTMSDYQVRQSAEAVQKLEKIGQMRGGSNEWSEVTRMLQEILATDAAKSIKADVKRVARLQLAEIAEKSGTLEQALHLLAEYIELFPTDTIVPEVLLRQGYILRQMGAYDLAISKFYLVGTAAARLPVEDLVLSERITLTAHSEIADTTYAQGRYKEATSFYEVLLKKPSDELNRVVIKTKLIRAIARSGNPEEVIKHGLEFLEQHGASEYQAEVRYLLASAYKAMGQKQESLRELMRLLEAVEVAPENLATKWRSWKMTAGNEIGNQLFLESDFPNAVQVYIGLVGLDASPSWQLPIYYQIGLCYEKNMAPTKALKAYNEIVTLGQKSATKLSENLQIVVEMARFRIDVISWRQSLEPASRPAETKVAEKAN